MKVERRFAAGTVEILVLVFFFGLLFLYSFHPNWDIDIFWHLETGEWISNNHRLPDTDIFSSIDKTRPWMTFQWAYEVITYQVNARLGFKAVRLMHALLYMGAFALLYATYRRRLSSRSVALALLVTTLVLAEDRFRVRPEAFNFFFTAIVLPILLDCAKPGAPRPRIRTIVLIAAVSLLWANIHAGGALTLLVGSGAMLGGTLLGLVLNRNGESVIRLKYNAWVFGTAAFLMAISPNFIRGNIHAFTMVNHSRLLIPEWHPPAAYFMPSMGGQLTVHTFLCGTIPYLVLGWAMLAFGLALTRAIGSRRDNDPDRREKPFGILLTALFFAVIAAQSSRFVYTSSFAIFLLLLSKPRMLGQIASNPSWRVIFMLVAGFLTLASFQYSVAGKKDGLKGQFRMLSLDNEPDRFPEKASDAIAAMGLEGRIFHFTAWGGYLLYRHFPECAVFTDGRGNFTLDERKVLIDTHRPWGREDALEEAWSKYPFEILLLPRPVFPMLTWDRTKWMLIYRDDISEAFLRVTPENQTNIQRAMAWWKVVGISSTSDPVAFQEDYRRVRGLIDIRDPRLDAKLTNAAQQAHTDSLANRVSGLHDGALILFGVGLHEKATKFFRMILDEGIRHSTAALYLAWCQYLGNREDLARETLMKNFSSPDILGMPDRGPLRQTGLRILDELGARVGLRKAAPQ
ncbi:MAG TPA: hypothetical protein PKH54_01390 [Myxococcota bacterium]|nr:hypothetical protein [Myxococcota bacterium]HOC98568.1 hypothetical protein [Myxococcota bacterium]HOH77244.1 hypothetical protein [Myxococcota bacterium]